MKPALTYVVAIVALASVLSVAPLWAHPASGIIVDAEGHVFIVYSLRGVAEVQSDGSLRYLSRSTDGHWLALDPEGRLSKAQPRYFQRITADGAKPTLIFAGGGSPITVGGDGGLYYATAPNSLEPGGLALAREAPDGTISAFSPQLRRLLAQIDDGVTGLASGPDGSVYVASWTGLFKVKTDGSATEVSHRVVVPDCDEDRADHRPSSPLPLLRGLAVDGSGNIYVAATSCHRVLKVSADGEIRSILNSERPWAPTGIALHDGDIYVLEYTNANGPKTEGWLPRVRKIARDGRVSTIYSAPADDPPR